MTANIPITLKCIFFPFNHCKNSQFLNCDSHDVVVVRAMQTITETFVYT